MNYREDLEIKLQKVTLAMQEVVDEIYKIDHEKQRIICELIEFKKQSFQKVFNLILNWRQPRNIVDLMNI